MAWFYGTNPRDINWCPALDWDGNIYIGTNDGGTGISILYSFAPDGTVRWADSINCTYLTDPVVDSAGHVIVGSSNGYIFVFNTDGDSLTSVYLGGSVNSPILGAGGNIYVGTKDSMFYAVGCAIIAPVDSVIDSSWAALDSRPPTVTINCPADTYISGENVHISWSIADSFWSGDPCSVTVHFCDRDTIFTISDTSCTLTIPLDAAECDSAYFVIAAKDSFGNWGYDTCMFYVTPPCSVWIDSVWFSEETECNDSNIVQICYHLSSTCPDSSFDVTIRISPDSGTTWVNVGEEWFSTLTDTDGDLGTVDTGLHCFHWIMNEDTVAEGRNWMLGIRVVYFLDTFRIVDSVDISSSPDYGRGLAYGDGYYWVYNYTTGKIYKTPCLDSCSPIDSVYLGTTNCDMSYKDGWIYTALSSTHPNTLIKLNFETEARETIFVGGSSWNMQGVQVIDSFIYTGGDMPPSGNYLLIRFKDTVWTSEAETLTNLPTDTCSMTEGLTYATGYLWGCNNFGRILQIDPSTGSIIHCYPVPNVGYGAEGLCWDGNYIWYHNNSTRKIYKIVIWDTTYSNIVYRNPLDSRPPAVNMACYADSLVHRGDTVHLEWTVTDSFWINQPCSLHIYGVHCTFDTTMLVADTFYNWVVPSAAIACDTLWFVVAARDSFCNWGYDSCAVIPACSPGHAELLCGPCGTFTSCGGQIVQWRIQDIDGIPIDFSRVYLTALITHTDSTTDTIYITGESDTLLFEPLGGDSSNVIITLQNLLLNDADSVQILLDSVFNIAGCKIIY